MSDDSFDESNIEVETDDVGEIVKTSFNDIAKLTRTISELVDQVKDISIKMASIENLHGSPAKASTSRLNRCSKSVEFDIPPIKKREVSDYEITQATERLTERLLGEQMEIRRSFSFNVVPILFN
jgi:hypothetical protein